MPCYHPISLKRPSAKRGRIVVPCGRCIGCRLERARQWTKRCMDEALFHKDNVFVTLTYRDNDLPMGNMEATLVPRDLELFWKRLRKEYGNGIRYFACGEYGERTRRPHYHACVFGLDFKDKVLHSTKNDINLYRSDSLDDIWGYGHCVIGDVTFESAAYVARYIIAKKSGPQAKFYEELGIEPEFVRMSRRPGLGSEWYEKYHSDIWPHGRMIVNGKASSPPRFYVDRLKKANPLEHEIQSNRRAFASEKKYWTDKDKGAPNLKMKERVKKSQLNDLTRDSI